MSFIYTPLKVIEIQSTLQNIKMDPSLHIHRQYLVGFEYYTGQNITNERTVINSTFRIYEHIYNIGPFSDAF